MFKISGLGLSGSLWQVGRRACAVAVAMLLTASAAHASTLTCASLFETPKSNLPAVYTPIRTLPADTQLASEVLTQLPAALLNELHRMRDLALEVGEARGLTKSEVENALDVFIESGAFAGELQRILFIRAVVQDNFQRYSQDELPPTRAELKKRLDRSLKGTSPEERSQHLNKWASQMAQTARWGSGSIDGLQIPNERELIALLENDNYKALLAVLYRSSMEPYSKMMLAKSAGRLKAPLHNAQSIALVGSIPTTVLGVMSPVLTGHFFGAPAEILFGGIAAATIGINFENTRIGQWISRHPERTRARQLKASAKLANALIDPQMPVRSMIAIPELKEFELGETYETFSIPMRAELAKEQIHRELMIDLDKEVSVQDQLDFAGAFQTMANSTFDLQMKRLAQIDKGIVGFEYKLAQAPKSNDEIIRSRLDLTISRYRTHLRALENDMNYVLGEMLTQSKGLADAHARALKMGDTQLIEQTSFALKKVQAKHADLSEKFAQQMTDAKAHLFAATARGL